MPPAVRCEPATANLRQRWRVVTTARNAHSDVTSPATKLAAAASVALVNRSATTPPPVIVGTTRREKESSCFDQNQVCRNGNYDGTPERGVEARSVQKCDNNSEWQFERNYDCHPKKTEPVAVMQTRQPDLQRPYPAHL